MTGSTVAGDCSDSAPDLGRAKIIAELGRVARLSIEVSRIPERSATGLREADLHILSEFGKQSLERRLEAEAFTGREVGGEDDLLDFLVGCPVDIEVARQPSA